MLEICDFYLNKSTANATEYDRHDKTIILCPKRGMTDSKFYKIPGKTNLVCDTWLQSHIQNFRSIPQSL